MTNTNAPALVLLLVALFRSQATLPWRTSAWTATCTCPQPPWSLCQTPYWCPTGSSRFRSVHVRLWAGGHAQALVQQLLVVASGLGFSAPWADCCEQGYREALKSSTGTWNLV